MEGTITQEFMRWLLFGQFLIIVVMYSAMFVRAARGIYLERRADRRRAKQNGTPRTRHPLLITMLWGMLMIVSALICSCVGISIVLLFFWDPELSPWRIPLWELEALLAFLGVLVFLRLEVQTDLPVRAINRPDGNGEALRVEANREEADAVREGEAAS